MLLWLVNLGFAAGPVEEVVTEFKRIITTVVLIRLTDPKG